MLNESTMKTKDDNQNNKTGIDRRKRINRIKTIIIIIGVLLMLLPSIGCIILSLQVSRLQKQVNELVNIHDQYGISNDNLGQDNYAYAAVKVDLESTKAEEADVARIEPTGSGSIEEAGDKDSNTDTSSKNTLADSKSKGSKNSKDSNESNDSKINKDNNNKDSSDSKEIESLSTGLYIGKKVYLTFDDGPSVNTNKILDILEEYNVKATFFVIGKRDKESKKMYQRIVDEGHTLGMHSYTHVYDKIYNSVEDFDKDFTKLWKLLYDTTGYKPSIFRFPAGSDNRVNKNGMEEFIKYLNEASIVYFDWNVLNGDATGVEYTKEQLIDNVLNGVASKETSIVLMHDSNTKETTVDSLPGLLDVLISEGAEILPLNEEVPPIQMIKADSIK